MNTPPPTFVPFRRRVRRKRRTAEPSPAALMLVAVEGIQPTGSDIEMNLVFNASAENPLLDPSGADPGKWTARYQGQKYVGTLLGTVLAESLYLLMTPTGAEAGADEISYANAPSDISDSLGRFLGAFSGLPI